MSPVATKFLKLWKAKEMAEERVITLTEIAKETGLTRRTLQDWQDGDITRFDANVLEALCLYFKCGIGDLLELREPQPRPPA